MKKGVFISIEGGEGAGKTSVIQYLEAYLCGKNIPVVVTREPGGIEIAEKIRELILDRGHVGMDARTEALLYAAARRQHLVEKIIPALKQGKTVLCDRYIDSSLAYQGVARGLGMEEILAINHFAVEGWFPDLTLYFDITPELGLKRIRENQAREMNRLDLERIEFHEKVRAGYISLVKKYPQRIKRINAEKTLEEVIEQSVQVIEQELSL